MKKKKSLNIIYNKGRRQKKNVNMIMHLKEMMEQQQQQKKGKWLIFMSNFMLWLTLK